MAAQLRWLRPHEIRWPVEPGRPLAEAVRSGLGGMVRRPNPSPSPSPNPTPNPTHLPDPNPNPACIPNPTSNPTHHLFTPDQARELGMLSALLPPRAPDVAVLRDSARPTDVQQGALAMHLLSLTKPF